MGEERLGNVIFLLADELSGDKRKIDEQQYQLKELNLRLESEKTLCNSAMSDLIAKDKEIERLKEEKEKNKKAYIILVDDEGLHHQINLHSLMDARHLTDKLCKKIREQQATIKEREAEANSYKELYKELTESQLKYAAFYKDGKKIKNPTHQEMIAGIKLMMEKYDKAVTAVVISQEDKKASDRKYDRLVALIKRKDKEWIASDSANEILSEHRDNEKKLKEQRKVK
jgi:hypothetical protein